ncbi:NAD(P)-dependent oxidoreductase [Synechococcus sp. MIT S9508]|uniref:NAD-dependent epimerase/dehydratase family protein n=1 Tax=Synechococcus sp. MIT S9508 TaxID=1801629 RepID=UPI0007BBC7FE|nr:NAD-dependent epimerase/dehydratase family protein [Synechococcus sp. MIT S9508]KZR90582.1 dTDP-glucose 4,6-dehydratase [Synechococcus sp. MIT S9508]
MRILITGVTGFIGSSILKYLLEKTDHDMIGLIHTKNTRFDYFIETLKEYSSRIYLVDSLTSTNPEIIIHCAASAQVPLTIKDPLSAFDSNVVFTLNLLTHARNCCPDLKKFIFISTGEVYGPNEDNAKWMEKDRLKCLTPYSATKAAGESLVQGYSFTYGIPSVILRLQSIFGERELPTKFFSQIISSIVAKNLIYLNGSIDNNNTTLVSWLHVEEVANALIFVINHHNCEYSEVYNLTGKQEYSLLESVQLVASILSKEFRYQIVPIEAFSRGSRCCISNDKITSLGFKHELSFKSKLVKFVHWRKSNMD